jgi:hypothetical protein
MLSLDFHVQAYLSFSNIKFKVDDCDVPEMSPSGMKQQSSAK